MSNQLLEAAKALVGDPANELDAGAICPATVNALRAAIAAEESREAAPAPVSEHTALPWIPKDADAIRVFVAVRSKEEVIGAIVALNNSYDKLLAAAERLLEWFHGSSIAMDLPREMLVAAAELNKEIRQAEGRP